MVAIVWRKIIVAICVYGFISVLISLISDISDGFSFFMGIIGVIVTSSMLFYLGTLIKNDYIRKNYFRCVAIVMGSIIIKRMLSRILNLDVESIPYDFVLDTVVFLTVGTTLFKIAKEVHKTNEIYSCLMYVFALLLMAASVIFAVVFIMLIV